MASFSVQYIFTLVDRFTPGATALAAAAGRIKTAVAAAGAAMGPLLARMAALTAGVALLGTMFMLGGVQKAAAFEDAMANVRRVTDISRETMLEYGKDVLSIGVATGQTGEEIAAMMAQGAMMGVRGRAPLAAFAETVAQVAVAWDNVSKEVAASSIARMSAQFFGDKTPEEQVAGIRSVSDTINELSNRSPFKAPEMLKFFDNASAAARRFGLTAQQAAAYGGAALVSSGPSGLKQGDQARMTFDRLLRAVAMPKKQQIAAMKSLGLDPKMLGTMLAQDAQGTLMHVLEKMEHFDPVKRNAVIANLLGDQRAATQFQAIAQNLNEYRRQLAIADDGWAQRLSQNKEFMAWLDGAGEGHKELADQLRQYGRVASRVGSVQREFQKRTETLNFAWKQFGLSVDRVQLLMAMPLLEPLRNMLNGLSGATNAIGNFVEANQGVSRYLMTGFSTAAVAAAGVGLLKIAAWATGASGALAVLAGIGIIALKISIVAAGIAAAMWIYDNWAQLKAFAADPLNFQVHFPDAPDWLKQFLDYKTMSKTMDKAANEYRGLDKGLPNDLAAAKSSPGLWNLFGLLGASAPSQQWFDAMNQRIGAFNIPPLPQPAAAGGPPLPAANPARIPQAAAERLRVESQITGNIDPLQVTVSPVPVNVTVTGQVNGPLTGTGSGTGSATTNAPRGVSTSEAGQASVIP